MLFAVVARRGGGWSRALRSIALALCIGVIACAAAAGERGIDGASTEPRVRQLRSAEPVLIAGAAIAARRLIAEFYQRRDFRPAWTTDKAHELLKLVDSSDLHGLNPNDYHATALRRLIAGDRAVVAADRDVLLTDALVRLVYHLRYGKANPRESHPEWNFARSLDADDPVQALELLVSAASLTAAVNAYAPRLPAYDGLRQALAEHRSIAAGGGWPAVPPGPVLKLGMRDPRVRALRARLAASGDGPAPQASIDLIHFDGALSEAVKRFQYRHGLDADGIVGARTLSALNVSVARRIDQLRVNLDRVRWVARDLEGDYLLVDIAGFSARLYRHGQLAWSSRVVVGQPYRSTPAFRASLRSIVLNPSWTVPPTILREDVLPSVLKDPSYLSTHRMQVRDGSGRPIDPATIDWRRYASARFPYEIVQAPGPANPLGAIKFNLPNPHAIYLHDTPARDLFARADRAFSSGCIRVESAHALAAILLDDAQHWNDAALRKAIETGETRTLALKQPVPVLLLYFTAVVDDHGTTRFHPDLYRRDEQVLAALQAPFRFHR